MLPLKFNQNYLEFFGFLPSEDGSSNTLTIVKHITILWITIGMDLIPTSYFIYSHIDDAELLISSLTPIIAFIVVSTSYLTFFLDDKRAVYTFTYIRALVNERTKSGLHPMYAEAEKKSFIVTKWPVLVTTINFATNCIFFAAQQIIEDWMNGDMNPNHWTITYKISTPFDQHTYLGFFLVNLWKTSTVTIYFVILSLVPAYFMSICFYVEAICADFETVIPNLNNIKVGYDAVMSEFITVINLQIHAVNLFKQMVKVVTGTIFVQVIGSTVFISSTLFQLEMSLGNFDTEIVMTIFAAIVAVAAILPYCYYASIIVWKIQHTANAAFDTNWYELPVHFQKNMKHIIAFAQLKRNVSGYGLFNCDLEGFMKIVKTAMSYFVMFRSFSE